MEGTILVATAGQGVLRSSDDGATWSRLGLGQDLEFDAVVRCLAVHPEQPDVVWAGSDVGLVRSSDAGVTWHRVDSPMNDRTIWSLAVDPTHPDTMLVGTGAPSRAAVFRTTDGGETWEQLPPQIPEFCAGVNRPRILTCTVDRYEPKSMWFGIEEGGLWRSRDGGDTWSVDPAYGDCEDYAMTKRSHLIHMGVPASALRIAYVKTSWGEGHAVLVVRTDSGELVLDNLTRAILPIQQTGLRVVSMSGANPSRWVRG